MPFQYAQGLAAQKIPTGALADTIAPTFAGITGLTPNASGTLTASWAAATDASSPIRYSVFLQEATATGLFVNGNRLFSTFNTSALIYADGSLVPLKSGVTYFVGVRAVDAFGNVETNTISMSAVSVGIADNSVFNIVTAIKAVTDVLGPAYTTVRAAKLDFLDALISSRATQTDINTLLARLSNSRANNLDNLDVLVSSRASQASIANIQNNTSFSASVPSPLILPVSGSKSYIFYARLFNEIGSPVDADSQAINVTIRDTSGSTVFGPSAMTRNALGQYQISYSVNFNDQERSLNIFFDYAVGAISFSQVRSTEVQEFESKLDTLLARLTNTRATNLDNLDQPISSRATAADMATLLGRLTATRAALIDNLDVPVSSRASLANQLSPLQTADAVWLGTLASYQAVVGSTGKALYDAGQSSSPAAIATAVWNEQTPAYVFANTFGKLVKDNYTDMAKAAALATLASSVGNIPTNPVLVTDPRIARLDVEISSRASALEVSRLGGAGYDPLTDNLRIIRQAIGAIVAGDATAANQVLILNALATKPDTAALNAVANAVAAIPLDPVLANDTRLDFLDAPITSRANDNDLQLALGGGFQTSTDSLVAISAALAAANLDITPVLTKLDEMSGVGFAPSADALKPLNDLARTERAQIKSDTNALLAEGIPFEVP